MGSIVVDVMLKPEILDPQGQAVGGALPRLGFEGFTDVRQGKRFVLTVDGDVTEEHLAAAREAAGTLLSNPVIEDVVSVHVLEDAEGSDGGDGAGAEEPVAADGEAVDVADGEAGNDEDDEAQTDGDVASEDESK